MHPDNKIPSVVPTLAPIVICGLLSELLAGVALVQGIHYHRTFPNDRRRLKVMVFVLGYLEVNHAFFIGDTIYRLTVLEFGNPDYFHSAPRALSVAVAIGCFVYPICQFFFAERLRILSGNRWLSGVSFVLAATRTAAGLASTVGLFKEDLETFQTKWAKLLHITLAAGTAADVVTSLSLCFYLWRKKMVGLTGPLSIAVDRLLKWTLQTAILACMLTMSANICFIFLPTSNWTWFGLIVLMPRVYTISLLASLNGRARLKNLGSDEFPEYTTRSPSHANTGPANIALSRPNDQDRHNPPPFGNPDLRPSHFTTSFASFFSSQKSEPSCGVLVSRGVQSEESSDIGDDYNVQNGPLHSPV